MLIQMYLGFSNNIGLQQCNRMMQGLILLEQEKFQIITGLHYIEDWEI